MPGLHDTIVAVQRAVREGQFTNESAVRQGAILPILLELGWPVFDTHIVAPEFVLESRRVDFALCYPRDRPAVLLEAKRVGNTEGADEQLFRYAFVQGVPLVILTDGREWHFYLPAERGTYDERRVYKLDLLERRPEECSERFVRYLSYSAVCSGQAIVSAREDYRDVAREREIEHVLPQAWRRLVEEPDEILAELLADKVEDICGYKPELARCMAYIRGASGTRLSAVSVPVLPPAPSIPIAPEHSVVGTPDPGDSAPSYTIGGVSYRCRTAREVAEKVLRHIAERNPDALPRISDALTTRKRRFISRSRSLLYDHRPDLEVYSVEFYPGWFMGTNYSRNNFMTCIEKAANIVGLRMGVDLVVRL